MKRKGLFMFAAGLTGMLFVGWFGFPRILYKNLEQPLQFSHLVHTGEKVGMACEDCHSFTAEGRFTGIPKVAKCAECHADVLGESAAEKILVQEYVAPEREIPWLAYSRQPENACFSHIQHVKLAEIKCGDCHGPHGTSGALRPFQLNRISGYSRDIWGSSISGLRNQALEGKKMGDCIKCHAKHNKVDGCIACHK
jgi:hypothetical protein